MDPIVGQLILQLVLILCNAVFACAEIAVLSSSDGKLSRLAEEGNKGAQRLLKLTEQPSRFLSTIQVAITLSGFLGSAFAAENFADRLCSWLTGFGIPIPAATLDAITVVLITLILSYITLICGELVPKRIAMKNPEGVALAISGIVYTIATLFSPIVWLLTISTNGVLRLLGMDPDEEDSQISEEEIRMSVDEASEKGVIDDDEKQIIQNVFEFDDLPVGELAVHRVDITMLWLEESKEEWEAVIRDNAHARFPVCDGTVDNIVGILYTRDYYRLPEAERTRENVLEKAVRPAYFVPETVRANVLFRHMKTTRNHFAVVLDEYGGMAGIVTMNDLLEQLVGELEDGDDEEVLPPSIERVDDNRWRVRGDATLDEVAETLGVELAEEVMETYDTFSGFVFGEYGSIPEDGILFEMEYQRMHIKVLGIAEHRVTFAMVTVAMEE